MQLWSIKFDRKITSGAIKLETRTTP